MLYDFSDVDAKTTHSSHVEIETLGVRKYIETTQNFIDLMFFQNMVSTVVLLNNALDKSAKDAIIEYTEALIFAAAAGKELIKRLEGL